MEQMRQLLAESSNIDLYCKINVDSPDYLTSEDFAFILKCSQCLRFDFRNGSSEETGFLPDVNMSSLKYVDNSV